MQGSHTKTLSRDLRITPKASYSQHRLNKSLSISSPQHGDETVTAVSTVRRQLKTLMAKVTEFSAGKGRGTGGGKVGELMDACSRLECNLDTVLKEHLPEPPLTPSSDFFCFLQSTEEGLLSQFRTGTNIPKLKAAVSEAFAKIRTQYPANSEKQTLSDSFSNAKHKQDLLELREANSELTTLNEELLRELTDTTEANKQLMQMLTRLQTDKVKSHRKLIDLKNTNHQLKGRIRQLEELGHLTAGELQNESLRLSEPLEDMYKTLDDRSFAVDLREESYKENLKMQEYEETISDLRSQLSRTNQLSSLQTSEIQSLKCELEQIKGAAATTQQSEVISKELLATRQAAESQNDTIKSLRSEIERLKSDALKGNPGNATALRTEIASLQTQCKQLSEEKTALVTSLQQSEQRSAASIKELKVLLETAQSQISISQFARKSSTSLAQSQTELELTVLKLQRESSELKNELAKTKEEYDQLTETLSQLQAEKTRLTTLKGNQVLASVRSLKEGKQESLQEFQSKISTLEDNLEEVIQERDQLLSKQHSDSLSEVLALQEVISTLQLENQELAVIVKHIQSRSIETANLDFKSIDEAKQHVIMLTQKLAGAEVTNTILKRKNAAEQSEHSPTQRDEEPMSVPKELGGRVVEELKEALKGKEEIAAKLADELTQLQSEMVTMRRDYDEKVKTLMEDNEAQQLSYEDFEHFFATTEKRYIAQIDNYKMEIETKSALFREQITANVKKISEFKRETEDLKREIDRLTQEAKTLQQTNRTLEQRVAEVRNAARTGEESVKETVAGVDVCKRLAHEGDTWWLLSSKKSFVWVLHPNSDSPSFSDSLACDSISLALFAPRAVDTPTDPLSCITKILSSK